MHRTLSRSILLLLAAASLGAQTPPSAPAAPAAGALTWRGALWASGSASSRDTVDGGLFLRGMEAGEGSFALDGAQLGVEVALARGWSLKVTLQGGQVAKVTNATSQETGSVAWPEAQLVWTGEKDTFRFGRMPTFVGIEFMDATQDITFGRGLVFTYADPVGQVGLGWRHAFSPVWSADLWVFNGEDRIRDNNKGKTAGLGLNYNHGGAQDRYVSLMAYRGPEQDGLGEQANRGAEERLRERVCLMGQWAWGASTLQWEAMAGRETFRAADIQGASGPGDERGSWSGLCLIFRQAFPGAWAGYARAELLRDSLGVRLGADPSVKGRFPDHLGALGQDLKASSLTLGVERKWGSVFSRLEARQDRINREVLQGKGGEGKPFKDAFSVTWGLGASF